MLVDNTANPPFPVMETSAEMLYLLKFADKDDKFGFKDEMERSQCLQWTFFWHGSGAPYAYHDPSNHRSERTRRINTISNTLCAGTKVK